MATNIEPSNAQQIITATAVGPVVASSGNRTTGAIADAILFIAQAAEVVDDLTTAGT
jgi:hypothetical protein